MTPEQREAVEKAAALLKQAQELDEQAWTIISAVATPENINDAIEVSLDCVHDDIESVTDDPAFRANSIIDLWEQEEEEEAEARKQVCAQCGRELTGVGKVIGCEDCDATLCSSECREIHVGRSSGHNAANAS